MENAEEPAESGVSEARDQLRRVAERVEINFYLLIVVLLIQLILAAGMILLIVMH